MVNTAVIFVMLIVTTILLAYATALGRLESRVILILIPAATVLLSALTLIARAENLLLLVVVGTFMAAMAGVLMTIAIFFMFRTAKEDEASAPGSLMDANREDSRGNEVEA